MHRQLDHNVAHLLPSLDRERSRIQAPPKDALAKLAGRARRPAQQPAPSPAARLEPAGRQGPGDVRRRAGRVQRYGQERVRCGARAGVCAPVEAGLGRGGGCAGADRGAAVERAGPGGCDGERRVGDGGLSAVPAARRDFAYGRAAARGDGEEGDCVAPDGVELYEPDRLDRRVGRDRCEALVFILFWSPVRACITILFVFYDPPRPCLCCTPRFLSYRPHGSRAVLLLSFVFRLGSYLLCSMNGVWRICDKVMGRPREAQAPALSSPVMSEQSPTVYIPHQLTVTHSASHIKMTTALHTWLTQAQESTRYDSVAAKYGLVVDTPSGMTQTGQNALRFLRSLTEHSPTFFDSQARLLSPPTPDLVPDRPASPSSALATPMSGPQRARKSTRTPRSPYGTFSLDNPDSDGLFAIDLPPDDPVFLPSPPMHPTSLLSARRPGSSTSRSRPYPACRAYTSPAETGAAPPLGYFPPPPDPSPSLDLGMYGPGWEKPYPGAVSTSDSAQYPSYASPVGMSPLYASGQPYAPPFQTQFSPQQQSFSPHPASPPHAQPASPTEFDMHSGDDVDRARMSALMYGSMRVRAVVAATEGDGQGW